MRFMMFMLPNVPAEGEWTPTPEAVATMSRYNDELAQAGALLALDGLHPQTEGHRVHHRRGSATVVDGPFTEAKEAIGGYWIIEVQSTEEALEWAKRVPAVDDGDFTIEVRQIFELEDFPAEVQAVLNG